MKDNIIPFIGDNDLVESEWFKNNYNKLEPGSELLYYNLHSDMLYIIFDEVKQYIRTNIDNKNFNIFEKYNYYLIKFLIPDKETLLNCVLEFMNLDNEIIQKNINLYFNY